VGVTSGVTLSGTYAARVGTDPGRPLLNVAALRRALLAPAGDYAALDVLATTGSTNTDLAHAAGAGAPDRTVLVAEHQTAGRGRNTRTWHSPPRAGLAFSVLLRPTGVPSARWGWLPLLAGVALADAVAATAGVDARLKWPNDLLAGPARRKCAGILGEVLPGPAVVIGIGLNVTQTAGELPPGVDATSLLIEHAACTDRDALLCAVLRRLSAVERRWRDSAGDAGTGGIRDAYRDRCATIGQRVRVQLPAGSELVGTATDVDLDGRLLVRDEHDRIHAVSAGDVIHLRVAPRGEPRSVR
jgi:BirA family transcriptional regulator, biotin operon repressor / biotin---[acetyl-CoA-carboxylase] ligase